jgi:photosystem II stability/assembly factor-like uncharacterized protein
MRTSELARVATSPRRRTPRWWHPTLQLACLFALSVAGVLLIAGPASAGARTVTFRADASAFPPETSVSDTSEGEWNNVDVTVTLTAYADSSSDAAIQSIWYRIDGGIPVVTNASEVEFVVPAAADHSNDGQHTITFHATDTLGGVEADQTHTVGIDTSGPGGSFKLGDGSGTTTSPSVEVDLSGLTDLSGVTKSGAEFSVDAKATWQPLSPFSNTIKLPWGQPNVTVWGHFHDQLGNESFLSQTIKRTLLPAPEVYAVGWDTSWHTSPVTATIYAWVPYIGGLASITYAVDGKAPVEVAADPNTNGLNVPVTIPAPADGSSDGVHSIAFSATSADGASSETKTVQVKIGHAPAGTPGWTDQTVPAGTKMLHDVDFVSTTQGWAVGEGGTILATTDGGAHWAKQSSGTAVALWHVAFGDATHGYAVGWTFDDLGMPNGNIVLATADGGATWKEQSLGGLLTSADVVMGVSANGAGHVWLSVEGPLSSSPVRILASASGGTSWAEQSTGVTGYVGSIDFVDDDNGWAYVGSFASGLPLGIVLHTTDGGAHWSSQSLGVMTKPFDVFALDVQHVWVSGYENSLVGRTSDGGSTWQTFKEGYAGIDMREMSFSDASNGWGLHWGYGSGIYRSIDGGATWQPFLCVPVGQGGIDVIDESHAWAVGGTAESGMILRYVSSPGTTDTAPPTTKASGVPAAWSKTSVVVTLTATDPESGVDKTYYRFGASGAFSVYDAFAKPTVTAQGMTTVEYYSTDKAGNSEAAKSATVRIDGKKPTTTAYAASGKKGRTVKLAYQVSDAAPGSVAKVTLKLYLGKQLKKTIPVPGTRACNVKNTYPWRCTLAKGSYTLRVYATDLAGNAQSKVGSARLTVK